MYLIRNQTPDSLTTMSSPSPLVHMVNSSKHEKMLGGSVHCRQQQDAHNPRVLLPVPACAYSCLLPALASHCLMGEQEGVRPLGQFASAGKFMVFNQFQVSLIDKYCSFLKTDGTTERHILFHPPEVSSCFQWQSTY